MVCHQCKDGLVKPCICSNFCGAPGCSGGTGPRIESPVIKIENLDHRDHLDNLESKVLGEEWLDALLKQISPTDALLIRTLMDHGMGLHSFSFHMNYREIGLSNTTSIWTIRLDPNIKIKVEK